MKNYHLAAASLLGLCLLSVLINWSEALLLTTFSGLVIGISFLFSIHKFYHALVSSKRKRGFVLLTILAIFFVISGSVVQYFQIGSKTGMVLIIQGVSLFAGLSFFHYRTAMRLEVDIKPGIDYRIYSIISIIYVIILEFLMMLFLMPLWIINKMEIIREVPLTFLLIQSLVVLWLWFNKDSIRGPIWTLLMGGLLINIFCLLL